MPDADHPQKLKRTIERGVLSYVISNGSTKVIGLANTVLVLSSLTTYAYGVAELAMSVVGALSIFQLAGLERTVIADMGVEKGHGNLGKARRILVDFLSLLAVFSGIAWGLLFFGSSLVGIFFTEEIEKYFVIISLLFLAVPFTTGMRILYAVYFDFTASALFTFLQEAFKLAFLTSAYFSTGITIATVLWSYVFVQIACILLLSFRTYSHWNSITAHPIVGSFHPLAFFWRHNLWTLVSNYADSSTKSVRLWIIKFFLGTEAVALFSVAQGMAGQLSSFLQIGSVVTPILPQYLNNRPVFFRIIDKTIKYQLLLAVVVIGGGLIAMPILVHSLFPHYAPSLPLFSLLVFVLVPTSISNIFQGMFYAVKAQRNLFKAQLWRLVLTIVFGSIFMPILGLSGVALEYVATTAFYAFERYRALKKLYGDFKIDWSDILAFDEYDRLLMKRVFAKLRFPS